MTKTIVLTLFMSFISSIFSQSTIAAERATRLNQLREAKIRNEKSIEQLRTNVKNSLTQLTAQPYRIGRESRTQLFIAQIQSSIENKLSELKRRYIQVDFWDRLQFETERNYVRGSYKKFLQDKLLSLAQTEALAQQSNPVLWQTFVFASWSVKNICNVKEDPLTCLSTQLTQTNFFKSFVPDATVSPQAKSKHESIKLKSYQDIERVFEQLSKSSEVVKTGHNLSH